MRHTDEILEQARADLNDADFALFYFYMQQYQPLCLHENKKLPTIDAWGKMMTFLEERMHELYPPLTVIARGELPPYQETENHGNQQVPRRPN